MKMNKKILFLGILVFFSVLFMNNALAIDAFTITEHTDYGLITNTVYINVSENLGQNQLINFSQIYKNNSLTENINYKTISLLQNKTENTYGLINTSLGVYQKTNVTIFNSSVAVLYYLKNSGEIVGTNNSAFSPYCTYALANQTCFYESFGINGTAIVSYWKTYDVNLSKFFNGGLVEHRYKRLTLPANSFYQLRLTYDHPLSHISNEPTQEYNKYNITISSVDGSYSYTLDPNWWNSSWNYKVSVNLTSPGNFSYFNMTYQTGMNADFSDLRFTNYTNDVELNYTIENQVNSAYAIVRVHNLGYNNLYAYYGNPSAVSSSNSSKTHFDANYYYYLDETSGTATIDSYYSNNGTTNATVNRTGKVGTSYTFDGVSQVIRLNQIINLNGNWTINWWMNSSDTSAHVFAKWNETTANHNRMYMDGDGNYELQTNNNTYYDIPVSPYSVSRFDMFTMKSDNGNLSLWINSSYAGSIAYPTAQSSLLNSFASQYSTTTSVSFFSGGLDEIAIWSDALTPSEIYELYTYSSPAVTIGAPEITVVPVVTFGTNPVNNYNDSDGTIVFDFKCSDDVAVNYTLLYTNISGSWVANYTNNSYVNNTWMNISVTGIPNGAYKWAVWCNDSAGNSDITTNRTFTVDSTVPLVQLTLPVNDTTTQAILNFSGNATDNIQIKNMTLYGNFSGSWASNGTNTSIFNNTNTTFSRTLSDGYYIWNLYACDWLDNCAWGTNRTLTLLSSLVTPTYPSNASTLYVHVINFAFNFSSPGDTKIYNCSLYLDGSLNLSNNSVTNNYNATIQVLWVPYGSHTWYISCVNSSTIVNSSTYSFTSGEPAGNGGSAGETPSQCVGLKDVTFNVSSDWTNSQNIIAIVDVYNQVDNLENINSIELKLFSIDYLTEYTFDYVKENVSKGEYKFVINTRNMTLQNGYYDLKLYVIDCDGHSYTTAKRINFRNGIISPTINVSDFFTNLTNTQKIALSISAVFILLLIFLVIYVVTRKQKR